MGAKCRSQEHPTTSTQPHPHERHSISAAHILNDLHHLHPGEPPAHPATRSQRAGAAAERRAPSAELEIVIDARGNYFVDGNKLINQDASTIADASAEHRT